MSTAIDELVADIREEARNRFRRYEEFAEEDLQSQAQSISEDLLNSGVAVEPNKEIIALIAYLQRLGTDIKVNLTEQK